MSDKIKNTFALFLLMACMVLCICLNRSCNKIKDQENFQSMYNEANDSLRKTHNKLGQEIATKELLYGSVSNLKKLHFADSTNEYKLQKQVDNLTMSVTILQNTTSGNDKGVTSILVKHDTVIVDHEKVIYPEYKTKFTNKWEDFDVLAKHDTTIITYKIFNEFDIKSEWKSQGLFKPKKAMIMVTNINPHTETKDIQNFTVEQPKNSRLKNILVGVGIGAAALRAVQIFLLKP
jgi:hypothetical protein